MSPNSGEIARASSGVLVVGRGAAGEAVEVEQAAGDAAGHEARRAEGRGELAGDDVGAPVAHSHELADELVGIDDRRAIGALTKALGDGLAIVDGEYGDATAQKLGQGRLGVGLDEHVHEGRISGAVEVEAGLVGHQRGRGEREGTWFAPGRGA